MAMNARVVWAISSRIVHSSVPRSSKRSGSIAATTATKSSDDSRNAAFTSAAAVTATVYEALDALPQVVEPRVLAEERQVGVAGRPVAVLGDQHLGEALLLDGRRRVVGLLAVEEEHDVAALLERAG